jgi:hypothetical protein
LICWQVTAETGYHNWHVRGSKVWQEESDELRKGLLRCFIADLGTAVKEPTPYDAGLKDPQQRQHWLDGDGVELNRIIGFEAYTSVPYPGASGSA